MQHTIAQQLGLDMTTVANFFMNARRRGVERFRDHAHAGYRTSSSASSTSAQTTAFGQHQTAMAQTAYGNMSQHHHHQAQQQADYG